MCYLLSSHWWITNWKNMLARVSYMGHAVATSSFTLYLQHLVLNVYKFVQCKQDFRVLRGGKTHNHLNAQLIGHRLVKHDLTEVNVFSGGCFPDLCNKNWAEIHMAMWVYEFDKFWLEFYRSIHSLSVTNCWVFFFYLLALLTTVKTTEGLVMRLYKAKPFHKPFHSTGLLWWLLPICLVTVRGKVS